MVGVVGFGEVAAAEQRGADGREVAGQDERWSAMTDVLHFEGRTFFPVVVVPVAGVVEGKMGDGRDGRTPGRAASLCWTVEGAYPGDGDAEGEGVVRREAGIEREDVDEGAGEQAGGEEENEGEGDFGGDEDAGEVTVAERRTGGRSR